MKSILLQRKPFHWARGAWVVALWFGWLARPAPAQPINLDTNPSFDFGDNPAANPLFTPQLLGLSASEPGFDRVNALTS